MDKQNKIKILHIGWGFKPWRGGGLIEYAEDLMDAQIKRGYDVYYFFAGRHYPFFDKPKLIKWKRNNVNMLEIINSPIIHKGDLGTLEPNLDISEPTSENFFEKIVEEIKPDIIHIQELAGLPSSIIETINKKGIPSVMTLHDYFLLCPTLKLFDFNKNICFDKNIAQKCVICCQKAREISRYNAIKTTLIYEAKKYHLYNILKPGYNIFRAFKKKKKNLSISDVSILTDKIEYNSNLAEEFQKRRDINIERLNKIGLLIAQSHKVAEIYKYFLNREDIFVIHSMVKHIEYIQPKNISKVSFPIHFGTLNGCTSLQKGAKLILNALKILNQKGFVKHFNFHIFGGLDDGIKQDISGFDNVIYHGHYDVNELNNILEIVDVGIVPSIWEEVYGYVGIEFLAKGIPIIGNARGGIVDYTIDGFTGWVNKENSAEGLANIMEETIKCPEKIIELNKKITENRDKIIKTIDKHVEELEELYKRVSK